MVIIGAESGAIYACQQLRDDVPALPRNIPVANAFRSSVMTRASILAESMAGTFEIAL